MRVVYFKVEYSHSANKNMYLSWKPQLPVISLAIISTGT